MQKLKLAAENLIAAVKRPYLELGAARLDSFGVPARGWHVQLPLGAVVAIVSVAIGVVVTIAL